MPIAQKRIIVDKYQEPQPNGKPLSIRQLSEYFTAKWKKKVGKSVIHRIIENKHEILTMQKTDKRVKLKQLSLSQKRLRRRKNKQKFQITSSLISKKFDNKLGNKILKLKKIHAAFRHIHFFWG